MEAHLRAGVAIYNAGRYHAAHDAWEDHWLDLESGTEDERFLHGLIQFTAAVFHATNDNDSGATGLAESAVDYLSGLPADYRGVNVGDVREFLADLARDPRLVEQRQPPRLTHEGRAVEPAALDFEATTVAAEVLAEEDGYDEETLARAVEYARADLADDRSASPFVSLLFDFVREPDRRGVVARRLGEHVDRRRSREEDVDGLFE
jgi:hypothetical protein